MVQAEFYEKIDSKVRRQQITSVDQLQVEVEQTLRVIKDRFSQDCERAEQLWREHVQSKIFKIIEELISHKGSQMDVQLRLLSEKVKLSEQSVQEVKLEKQESQGDARLEKEAMETERSELIKNEKVLEHKVKQLEAKM